MLSSHGSLVVSATSYRLQCVISLADNCMISYMCVINVVVCELGAYMTRNVLKRFLCIEYNSIWLHFNVIVSIAFKFAIIKSCTSKICFFLHTSAVFLQLPVCVNFVANFCAEFWAAQCANSPLHASAGRMFATETQHTGIYQVRTKCSYVLH